MKTKSTEGLRILEESMGCWQRLAAFRRERERNKDYAFGRQWNDWITVNGHRMTEHDYIVAEGNIPLQNNLIRRILRNVLGVFRSQLKERMETWSDDTLRYATANRLEELFSRNMEEFLISGMTVMRRWKGWRNGEEGAWTDPVSPDSFFFDSSTRDMRGWDVQLLGQLHDVTLGEWCDFFVKNRADYDRLHARLRDTGAKSLRVVEVWRHERRPRLLVHDPLTATLRVEDYPSSSPDTSNLKPKTLIIPPNGSSTTCGVTISSTWRGISLPGVTLRMPRGIHTCSGVTHSSTARCIASCMTSSTSKDMPTA